MAEKESFKTLIKLNIVDAVYLDQESKAVKYLVLPRKKKKTVCP